MSDKKNQLKKAYDILPPDYLNRIDGEDHFTLLSEEELQYIVEHCVLNCGFDEEEIITVVRNLEQARCAALTLQRFLDKQIEIIDLTPDGEIIWRSA